MKDVGLLGERVRKLQTHFNQANEDIRQIADLDREDRERAASASSRSNSAAKPRRAANVDRRRRCRKLEARRSSGAWPAALRCPQRAAAAPVLARNARGLSQAARADRHVPRLFVGPAARAVRLDAAGLDARSRRRSRHHRPVRAGRHALHAQIPLGAADRRARRAGAVAAASAGGAAGCCCRSSC